MIPADGSGVWADEGDALREGILSDLGYAPGRAIEHMRRCEMTSALTEFEMPEGYFIRALGNEDELPARAFLSWRAFHPNDKYTGSDSGA